MESKDKTQHRSVKQEIVQKWEEGLKKKTRQASRTQAADPGEAGWAETDNSQPKRAATTEAQRREAGRQTDRR
jgi:hypothetical protein